MAQGHNPTQEADRRRWQIADGRWGSEGAHLHKFSKASLSNFRVSPDR